MNEELTKSFLSEISTNPQEAKVLLEAVKECIAVHKICKRGVIDIMLFASPLLTKEGGEAVLEAFQRTGDSDNKEKKELIELKSYWLRNYADIVKVIQSKWPT